MKLIIIYYLFIYLLIFSCINVKSQEIIKVTARGKSISPGNLSLKEAKIDAIKEAKKNALKEAGINESISFSSILFTTEDNLDFSQLFNEISIIESDGEIVIDTVYDISQEIINGNLYFEVEITATIFKYESVKDPTFSFKIEGINDVYYTSEKLAFSFTPSSDGYLKIFNINNNNAGLIYPTNLDNKEYLCIKNKTIIFPISPAYKPGYHLQIDSKTDDFEINNLIFVFTKKNIEFHSNICFNNIMKWIYQIPPDERFIKYYSLVIKKLQINE